MNKYNIYVLFGLTEINFEMLLSEMFNLDKSNTYALYNK